MKDDTKDKLIDIAHDASEVAKNMVEPASKNIGGALGTFTGFFFNVVLYPLKCLNSRFEQKAIAFERKMQEKYNNIPEQNRVDAPVNILGPVLENLKYNIDEEYMQELYANLLQDTMDKTKQSGVHPKYVTAISAMDEMDAKIFEYLYRNLSTQNIRCGRVKIKITNTNRLYANALPEWVMPFDIEDFTIFDVSKSLIRLSNLGFLDLMYDRTAGDSVLEELYAKKEVQQIFQSYLAVHQNVELSGTDCVIAINDDGRNFGSIVFKE